VRRLRWIDVFNRSENQVGSNLFGSQRVSLLMNAAPKKLTASSEQLVRKPAREVFAAFVEPWLLVQFWLATASGPLEPGRKVHWEFMVKGAADDVEVLALESDRRIRVRWSDGTETEWTFTARGDDETVVRVEQSGFTGELHEIVATALEATQGYTIVLCDLKVLLEGERSVRLVADKAELIEQAMADGGRT
jgi:uncharacterized protein YndB with AHSA1/START domain